MRDILSKGVVELGLDDSKLQEQLPRSMRTIKDSMTPLKSVFKESFSEQLAKANVNAIKLTSAFAGMARHTKTVANELRDANRSMQLSLETQRKLYGNVRGSYNYAKEGGLFEKIGAGLGAAKGALAAGAGLTLAGAAAAGSTTLNTLIGSLRMLSLAAGEKTQAAVLKVSKNIQSLARVVESAPGELISGGITGVAGIALGARYGGWRGGLAGGLIGTGAGVAAAGGSPIVGNSLMGMGIGGMIGGGVASGLGLGGLAGLGMTAAGAGFGGVAGLGIAAGQEFLNLKKQFDGEIEKLAVKVRRTGENEAWKRADEMAKMGAVDEANAIRKAVVLAQRPDFIAKRNEFLTAGLGTSASYVGLADVRQQMQMAGFQQGALETQNMIKELQLNTKALQENAAAVQGAKNVQGGGQGVQPHT